MPGRGRRKRKRKRRNRAKIRGKKDRKEEGMMEIEGAEVVIMNEEAAAEDQTMIEAAGEEVITIEAVEEGAVKTEGEMTKVIMTDLQQEEVAAGAEATKLKKNDKCEEGMMIAINENRSTSTTTTPPRTR